MADSKQQKDAPDAGAGAKVTQTADDSPGGVNTRQVEPIQDRPKAQQTADLTSPGDIELGVLSEPDHPQDQTPYPVGEQPPIERPPFATGRPDVPIVQAAVTGAGAHTPPPAEDFTPDGRPRDLQ